MPNLCICYVHTKMVKELYGFSKLINSSIVHCLEIVEAVRLNLENFKAYYTSEHIDSLLADGSTVPVGS